jgi:hypothetical protein
MGASRPRQKVRGAERNGLGSHLIVRDIERSMLFYTHLYYFFSSFAEQICIEFRISVRINHNFYVSQGNSVYPMFIHNSTFCADFTWHAVCTSYVIKN